MPPGDAMTIVDDALLSALVLLREAGSPGEWIDTRERVADTGDQVVERFAKKDSP